MGDIIISMLESIFAGSFASGAQSLRTSIIEYNESAYHFAQNVNTAAVKPVAAVIVGIILVLELARISIRYTGEQKAATQVVCVALVKSALLIIAIQHTDLILAAMNGAGDAIIGATSDLTPAVTDQQLPESLRQAVEDTSMMDKAGLMLVLFIPWLLAAVGSIAVKIVVFIRFAELYVLSAAATLPMAFLGNPDTKSIAIGFLKRYGGVVLHGVMIVIIIAVYSSFQFSGIDLAGLTGDNLLSELTKNFGALIGGPVVFMYLLFGSGRLARSMLGDG
ncbi:Uncharacterised protein [Actinobaculum suis]|uniref:Conjugal transfer protein TrbL n=1 Tax=Actinobaculum suis TaxID=1657 RepID=A0A7Z9C7Z1_9ACTO|nr:hypothetical protein [Actinobaculum suis]VDG75783.1 Uncharacterised protein [Actinobaculum suis]